MGTWFEQALAFMVPILRREGFKIRWRWSEYDEAFGWWVHFDNCHDSEDQCAGDAYIRGIIRGYKLARQ